MNKERAQNNPIPLNLLLKQRRRELAKTFIIQQETSRALAELWKPQALSFISENKVLEQFQEPARELIEKFSRPCICAVVISNIADECFMPSPQMAITLLPREFIMGFDVSIGLHQIVAAVYDAEDRISGKIDDLLFQSGVTEEKDIANIYRKNIVGSGAKLLMKDPTGFSLVDETVRGFKGEKDSPLKDYHEVLLKHLPAIPSFVIAGAELGAELYKKLYALCPSPKIPPKPIV